MIRRLVLAVCALSVLGLTGSAEAAASASGRVAAVPECRAALTQDVVDLVAKATKDPGPAWRRRGASPATVECASASWKAKAQHARAATKVTSKSSSAAARPSRLVSRAGRGPRTETLVVAETYAGPPNDHVPVHAIRTPPLRTV